MVRLISRLASRKTTILTTGLLLVLCIFLLSISRTSRSSTGTYLPSYLQSQPAGYDPKAKATPLRLPKPAEAPLAIVDNFPAAATAKSMKDLPPVPAYNKPPSKHSKHATPLFIGFTRNWRLLQQTVVSYIVAGWPPGDIYVVENTGTMQSNRRGQLTLQNPFYLNYDRLTKVFGIKVLTTPTLLTFAQLQNFYMYTAMENSWEHYWWAHMDTVANSDETFRAKAQGRTKRDISHAEESDGQTVGNLNLTLTRRASAKDDFGVYKSLYTRALDKLEETLDPAWGPLATLWFHYDHLALVRTSSFAAIGGWDTMIPFYMTDCDMHERLWMHGLKIESADVGMIWDVASTLDDLGQLFHRANEPYTPHQANDASTKKSSASSTPKIPNPDSQGYKDLLEDLDKLQVAKHSNERGRNTWQAVQKGGQGEPFYRDSDGFERVLGSWMDHGRDVFAQKWGYSDCDLRDAGLKEDDAYTVIEKWRDPDVRRQYFRDREQENKQKNKGT